MPSRKYTLTELILIGNQQIPIVQDHFGSLTHTQLNWKASPNSWSAAQCLDHLCTTNRQYFPQIRACIEGTKRATFWERWPFLPALFGRSLIKSLSPDTKRKSNAPEVFQPSQGNLPLSIIAEFLEDQRVLLELMKQCETLDRSIKITSPVASFISYSLHDAFTILMVHEQRHIAQAQRVTQDPAFPA